MTCAVWRRLLFLLVLGLAGSGNLTPAGASIGGPFTGGAQQIAAVYEYDGQLSCTQDLRPSGSPLMSQRLAADPFGDQVEGRGRYDEPHSTSTTRLEFVATNTGAGEAGAGAAGEVKGPADSPVWGETKPARGKTRTNGENGRAKEYYEWDFTHNDIEVYDRNGRHKGSKDPTTGEMTKPPVPGRRINV